MVEISRLDAITSNKMKSDFISSISHEFRSPLHGILASAELLRDSNLDLSQLEFIATIQNCSETLLDTINHVLDYSKINSFEKKGAQAVTGTIANELIQATNLALLCEDVISGLMAAREFHGSATDDPSSAISKDFQPKVDIETGSISRSLNIILDIEKRDWYYNTQAGALKRVIMNIFGNALKYTESGFIMVQMQIKKGSETNPRIPFGNVLSLKISDSGRGMSTNYMERKLYHPFAQEDSFAPGVGLGLSIVRSIVKQLGGQISISSQIGKGTEVNIAIPVEKVQAPPIIQDIGYDATQNVLLDTQLCITRLRHLAKGKSISFSRTERGGSRHKDITWSCVQRYSSEWFGFTSTGGLSDIVVTDDLDELGYRPGQRILIAHKDVVYTGKRIGRFQGYAIGRVCSPIGPFKLARCLLALMETDLTPNANDGPFKQFDRATQTPVGSPAERPIMNEIILTDYGFTPEGTVSNTPISTEPEVPEIASATEFEEQATEPEIQTDIITRKMSELNLQQPSITETPMPPKEPKVQVPFGNLTLPPPKSPAPASTLPVSLRILAVDDNPLNLKLLKGFLSKRTTDIVVSATDGSDAVKAVVDAGQENKFDIIFMDISMPKMDGFEATRTIRKLERDFARRTSISEGTMDPEKNALIQRYKEENENANGNVKGRFGKEGDIKRSFIVALTGLASRRDRDEADESGFDDFLTKPVSFKEIGKMLKRMSDEKSASLS